MHPKGLLASFLLLTVRIASAQPETEVPTETAPTPPAPAPAPPPPPASTSSSTTASLGTDDSNVGTAFGVGAQALLTGPAGPALVYNTSRFHIEGVFAFADVADIGSFTIAGRAWLHLHNSKGASLSVGGGAGLQSSDSGEMPIPGRPAEKISNILIEGGAQIRFFATRNVAISASMGLALVGGDGDSIAVTGQVTGAFGITYFIF